MAKDLAYGSFRELKSDLLRHRAGPLVSAVEDIADDIFSGNVDEEFDTLWDKVDREDDE